MPASATPHGTSGPVKPASGYPHEQPLPGGPKMPGRGRPDESQNDPDRKPGESPEEE